ncbi:MAG: SUMF1/EgtB/PvdO family nonheme iron enzyme [Deltaproteobacteria bacterium]|nr:SUMF1/EgtB/PvdO family nonheme iron enzyme [Deltaproteobacteria bacterium]
MRIRLVNGQVMLAGLVMGLWSVMATAAWAAAPVVSNDKASAQSGPPVPTTGNMVLIPAGAFNMGDPYKEGDEDELPVHQVSVSAFYLEKYPVTGKQWKEVYDWAEAHGYGFDNPGAATADTHPVQTVSWYDVVKWLNARSEKEGRTPAYYTDPAQTEVYRTGQPDVTKDMVKWTSNGYRLPTEAEWEKAARGGLDGHHYPWSSKGGKYSDHIGCRKANYNACNGKTTPVGAHSANGYGLYDMAGNVWEWVWDKYDKEWYGQPEATSGDTRGSDSASSRANRGGSWFNNPDILRCSYRYSYYPSLKYDDLGFRAASTQP